MEGGAREGFRFGRLVRWELRHLRGRRRDAWWAGIALAAVVVATGAWWLASQPQPESEDLRRLQVGAAAWLLAAPVREPVARLGQLTFGYHLARLLAWGVGVLARVALPVMATGSVSDDRRAGRLADVQLTLLSAREIYLAKVVAAALPFVAAGLLLLVLVAPVLVAEAVPASELGRIVVELAAQVLLTAAVAVTASALFRSRWAATLAAAFLLWILLPLLWGAFLIAAGAVPLLWRLEVPLALREPGSGGGWPLQLGFTLGLALLAGAAGVRRLRRLGLGRAAAPAGG